MYIVKCHTVYFTHSQQNSIYSEHIIIIKKVVQNFMIEAVWAFLQQWAINVNMNCDLFRGTGSCLFNIHKMQPCMLL